MLRSVRSAGIMRVLAFECACLLVSLQSRANLQWRSPFTCHDEEPIHAVMNSGYISKRYMPQQVCIVFNDEQPLQDVTSSHYMP